MNEELKVIISAEISDLKQGVSEAQDEIDKLTTGNKGKFEEFSTGFTQIGDTCKRGLAIVAGAAAGAATALLALPAATEEYRTAQAKLNSAFEAAGGSAEVAKSTYNDLYRVLGDGDVAVEAAGHLAKLTTSEQELAEWTDICQGVYATFGDSLPIEGLTEAVNHTAKLGEVQGPLADALEWAGINADTFNEQLAECATEGERAALIQDTLNGLYGEAAAAYEENAASLLAANEAQAKLDESLAALGEAMAPIMTTLKELAAEVLADLAPYIQEFANKYLPSIKEALSGLGEKIGEAIGWIADHWGIISTVGTIVLGIATAISVLSTGLGIYNTVMGITAVVSAPIAGIILGIVAAIAAIIAIIVVCVKHWDEIKAKVVEVWDKIKTATAEAVQKVKDKFNEMKEKISDTVENIKNAVKEKFEAIKQAIQEKVQAVKEKVTEVFTSIKDAIVGKITEIKNKISEVFGGIKSTISDAVTNVKTKVSDGFNNIKSSVSNTLGNVKSTVTSVFDGVKNGITNKINAARDAVKGAIDKIKGFFNFKFKWPDIPLPHLSISPSGWKIGDLLKGSIPKLGISWYAKGGVFDDPTLFGYGNGMLGGLGENGAEAVVPLEKNTEWMNVLAARLSELMRGGNTPIILQVDGKTFAQTTVDSINQLTRQRGSLALNLV